VPVIGMLIRKVAVARFTRTLGTLISSGVPILEGLLITARSAGNRVVEKAVMQARQHVTAGGTLSEPLKATPVFPPMVVHLLPLGILLPTEMTPGINHGVLALALLTVATSSGGLLFGPPLARPRRIAWLIALLDVALVTGVVAATGGPRSIFTFLYVMLVTASCVTLSRTGGL